jgi:hypothetical protein
MMQFLQTMQVSDGQQSGQINPWHCALVNISSSPAHHSSYVQ